MAEYVNGKELFAELSIYHKLYTEATEKGEAKPQISNTIAHAIIQIATRMANSWNFVGYTYKDEMISDAILKCYEKIHRFDPSISNNSFGFVSQVTWNSFINRITNCKRCSNNGARRKNSSRTINRQSNNATRLHNCWTQRNGTRRF